MAETLLTQPLLYVYENLSYYGNELVAAMDRGCLQIVAETDFYI